MVPKENVTTFPSMPPISFNPPVAEESVTMVQKSRETVVSSKPPLSFNQYVAEKPAAGNSNLPPNPKNKPMMQRVPESKILNGCVAFVDIWIEGGSQNMSGVFMKMLERLGATVRSEIKCYSGLVTGAFNLVLIQVCFEFNYISSY